ncbi:MULTISPECIES: FecR family protein [Rhodanobacter]|uniref:FecR family protein n=2 Tax=Rhodanobacter TaxID=75309 RepID=A0A1I4FLG9_9GAMM|nr:FecR domain-containing protein [Rhodanobacter glycinis]SFL18734.1 FecR family protein [Rhodanobacter glycinis]
MDRHSEQREAVPGAAERWYARLLEADCPDADRAACARWRAADPAHEAAWRELDRLWQHSATAARHPAVAAAALRALHYTPPAPWYRRQAWLWPATAVAVAAVAVLAILPHWRAIAPAPGTTYSTAIGQQRSVNLPDGTTVTLDTQSSLVVRYDAHERSVDLLRGRAQFSVRANPQRPFVVHVGNGTITDVGTVFQVRTDKDCTGITLIEGELDIAASAPDHATERVSLHSGKQLWFDRSGHISPVQPADLQAAEGWTEGKLFVHDWKLPDLLAEMNRYNRTQVSIGDPALDAIRISGVFDSHDPHTMLQLLQRGWPIRARADGSHHVVLLNAARNQRAARPQKL